MAVINPPGFLQNAGATHTAEQMRNWHGLLLAGKTGATSLVPRCGVNPGLGNALVVTQTGSPSMAIVVKSGHATVPGTENAKQGAYSVLNDADVTLSIAAAHATLNRLDIVVFKVEDSGYSGLVNTSSLVVVTGTPASVPAAPAAPANSIILGQVSIVANATSITNADITDRRPFMASIGGAVTVASQAERDALFAYESLCVYRRDTDVVEYYDGAAWKTHSPDPAIQTWAPTLTNFAVGAGGTLTARFWRLGNMVNFHLRANLGTGFSVGSSPRFTLPVAPAGYEATEPLGVAFLLDAGTANWSGYVWWVSGSTVEILRDEGDGTPATISSTTPFTWALTDRISCSGSYFV